MGNNWGRWGDDDERGALNLLTPDVIKAAAASITTGKVYSLGIPIQGHGVPLMDYRGTPMRLTLQDGTDDGIYAVYGCHEGTGAHEDVLVMASHTTSHMDALVHVYGDYKHYNDVDFNTMTALGGAKKLGIDKVGGLASRGVLLDMVRYFADDNGGNDWVTLGRNITGADLEGAAKAQGVEVRAGDIVMIRTGYLQFWWDNMAKGTPQPFEQAGIGLDAAAWLADKDVVAVASDNAAVEVIPFENNDFITVHKELLVKAGIYLLEFINLVEPAADENYEGIFAVGPLKVTGATGSPVNPIFIT
ncbi:MAG TPA: cyclase family protein [Ilumatobacteraceae bacterium]|nr:cyclase family protein [Ilumatobacteraceae bacterium]